MTDVTIQQNIVTVVETNTSPTVRAQQTTVTVTPTTSGVAVTPTTSAVTITAATPTTAVTVAPTSVAVTVPSAMTLLTVEEQDGSPSVTNVSKLRVSNGTLTNNGGGVVTVVTGSGVGGGATVLDDLTDVTLTSPSNTQVLLYNGAGWVNATNAPAFSAITGKPTTLSGYGITDAATAAALSTHIADISNPHAVTLAQVGGAPVGAKYIVQTADSTLTNEQALGALATGLLKNTTSTGVLAIAVGDTDYTLPATFSAHTGATTSVHGIADTSALVLTSDSRLSDSRTPTTHATSHQHGGSDEVATATAGANAIPKSGSGGTLAVGWIPSLPASQITSGQLALARGGTGADLSATGGANQVVKQTSVGGVLTVGALIAGDIPSLDSGKITSGEIPRSPLTTRGDLLTRDATTHVRLALGSSGKFVRSDGTDPSWQLLVAGDIPTLDTSKLTSGTMATARLGSGTADNTTFLRGDNTWQTISAGGVSGSGTTGKLAKWSSSSALTDGPTASDVALLSAAQTFTDQQTILGTGKDDLIFARTTSTIKSRFGVQAEGNHQWAVNIAGDNVTRDNDGKAAIAFVIDVNQPEFAVYGFGVGESYREWFAARSNGVVAGYTANSGFFDTSDFVARFNVLNTSSTTSAVDDVLALTNNSTSTASTGYGAGMLWRLKAGSTKDQNAARTNVVWADGASATRKGRRIDYVSDASGDREYLRAESDGSNPMFSVLGAPASARITLPAAATDAATTQTLSNALRSALITFGFCN